MRHLIVAQQCNNKVSHKYTPFTSMFHICVRHLVAALAFPKSMKQNCSEKKSLSQKHGRVPRGGRVIEKEIKLKYV